MRLHVAALLLVAAFTSIASFGAAPRPASAATTVLMYGTTGAGNTLSSLYRIDPATGAGTLIGATGYRGVSGIDFHPQTGVLYGVGRRQSDDVPVLLRINTTTGAATEVGATQLSNTNVRFPDISFRHSDATLFAYSFGPERLVTINVTTGAATFVGPIVPAHFGDGTAFDFNGTLYNASFPNLDTVNPANGSVITSTPMTFAPDPTPKTVGALAFHSQTGALYGVTVDAVAGGHLVLVNKQTGVVTAIGPTVLGLDSLAIQPAAPTVSKTFGASSVVTGSTTTLSFTLSNPNLQALSGVGFIDQLPSGLVVATPNGLVGSCGGTVTAAAAGNTITLANGTLGPSASCTFSVTVLATASGALSNTTGTISSAQSGAGGTAAATLAVNDVAKPPPPIPQVFQNPGAVAIVSSLPPRAPTPRPPAAVAPAVQLTSMPVLRPPSTGNAGLKLE